MSGNLRTIVRGAYDIQKLRIQMGNRIVGNFKAKLGQQPGKPEEEMDAEGKKILANIRASYKKITDGVKTFPRQAKFSGDGVIGTYTELCLVAQYLNLEDSENRHFKHLGSILKEYPIYNAFLADIKGIGPAMAGVIISEIDIHKAMYPSSLWKYAGLDVAPDGKGRSRKAEHLVRQEYINKSGEQSERNSITFNPWLKTKLIGVLATSFLRAGDNYYRVIYDGYKHRLENHPDWQEKTKGHRHNASMRYMVKMFLRDLYVAWRTLENLPIAETYQEAKLGKHHKAA